MAINLKRAVNFQRLSKLKSVVLAEGEKTQNLGDQHNKVMHKFNSDKSLARYRYKQKTKE